MTSRVRTTADRRLHHGLIGVDGQYNLWEQALLISGSERKYLALRNLDMLPAEQTRID